MQNLEIAILIPCYNEATTIRKVVMEYREILPHAKIYVYDNNSTDQTIAEALIAGAIVRNEFSKGKGNVVRRMFAEVEADIYILVDGDSTYDAQSAPKLIHHLTENSLAIVNAARITTQQKSYRIGHIFGNKFLSYLVHIIFGNSFADMLSGYKVFSRRFVKSFPIFSRGFEIETEITVHALELSLPIGEIETPYFPRPTGSTSKLSTFKDGFSIIRMIFSLVRKEKPLLFFAFFSVILAFMSLLLSYPIFITYIQTGLVPRIPTVILNASLMILACLSMVCGFILENVSYGRKETKILHYLAYSHFNFHKQNSMQSKIKNAEKTI